ncbi:MAG: ADP-glyceromanno-heptose 6-epimerase [Cytophagales bacterium]|nr:ADP-glyceromanno-heptose 6-epimerase [Cytophagales bacterium]
MIVVTGAAGFIGSCLIQRLNQDFFNYIIAVDDFSSDVKIKNLQNKKIKLQVHRNDFFDWLDTHHRHVEYIFHIGARTDTTELDTNIFDRLNVAYSQKIWQKCIEYQLPLVYASSAATYGSGSMGYDDAHDKISSLSPLNPYGISKNEFDKWALAQPHKPYSWVGLKFFNVYGPNEYHKGRMASVVYHGYHQIKKMGVIKLFKSHKSEYKDGEQLRDFIYVKDVVEVCMYFLYHRKLNGIYNLGTGTARTFNELATHTFDALGMTPAIQYIDMPPDLLDKYQYFTEAKIQKLTDAGYRKAFYTLQEGVHEYVNQYLNLTHYY